MCLILFSYKMHPDFRVIIAANRDEFFHRPTSPLNYWSDHPAVLAGRDLKGSGTWLGLTTAGRIAAITNYRDPATHTENAPSRGILVRNYLIGNSPPQEYLEAVCKTGSTYNGFNLIAGDASGLYYCSNRASRVQPLQPGLHGISNHLLETAWPKIQRGKALLQGQLSGREKIDIEKIWGVLGDRTQPPDEKLPDTGVGLQWERVLAPLFISSPTYGTRSSSIVLMEYSGQITFMERTFIHTAGKIKTGGTVEYKFNLMC
jgi:uncharacterized protein with NRDE domain